VVSRSCGRRGKDADTAVTLTIHWRALRQRGHGTGQTLPTI
jgi:hypothetical protein